MGREMEKRMDRGMERGMEKGMERRERMLPPATFLKGMEEYHHMTYGFYYNNVDYYGQHTMVPMSYYSV